MSFTKQLEQDMSRKDFELPQYGDVDESYREFEDLYSQGIWPSESECLEDAERDEA